MSPGLEELLELLTLERIDKHLFRAFHPKEREHRLYGGQIMAQALRAAAYTAPDDRAVHSLHGYFLRPGDPKVPALIDVEPIRDGRAFSTRRVVVIQHGQAIFNMDASFQVSEPGLTHQMPKPDRQPPTDDMVPKEMRDWTFLGWRHDHKRLSSSEAQPPYQDLWFKANGRVPDEPILHACLAVYESDNALFGHAVACSSDGAIVAVGSPGGGALGTGHAVEIGSAAKNRIPSGGRVGRSTDRILVISNA